MLNPLSAEDWRCDKVQECHKDYYRFFMIEKYLKITESVVQRCSVEKVFLEISQNSQENTCARVSILMKLQASAYFNKVAALNSGTGVFL